MATRAVLTDNGREWLGRFLAGYTSAPYVGYELFSYAKWGEGGWETVSGIDVPRDPNLFITNNDLEIVADPGSYPGFGYYTGKAGSPSAGFPNGLPVDLPTEVLYIGGAELEVQVTGRLALSEEADDGTGNPRLFEVGIFDNALDVGLDTVNHLISYCTFDGFLKTLTRAVDVDMQIPMKP